MKFEATASLSDEDVERIADAVFAKLKAEAVSISKAPAEVPATAPIKTPKPTKPKAADKPKADETVAPAEEPAPADEGPKLTQDDVQVALKNYAKKTTREAAFAILKKYAGSVAELSSDDLPKVIAELNGTAAAPAEDDPF